MVGNEIRNVLVSFFGPLTFIMLISLRTGCVTDEFIDNTTMTEVLQRSSVSSMQSFVDYLVQQSTKNAMKFNVQKTKEMLSGSILKDPLAQCNLNGLTIDGVYSFRWLRVHISNDLKWTQHVKMLSTLHFWNC